VSERELRVEHDRVHALYAQGTSGSIVSAVVGTLVVAGLWSSSPHALLVAWYAALLADKAARILMVRWFRRENPQGERLSVWARRYTVGIVAAGVILGSAGPLLLPHASPLAEALLLVVLIGMAAGSITGLAYHPPAMIAYPVTTLLPSVLHLLLKGTLEHALLALAIAVGLAAVLMFGRNQAGLIRRAITVGHENADLLAEVRAQKELADAARRKAEQASLAKSQFFAAASHDLRQPMQALGLFAASLRETKRDPADARRIDQILSSVDTLESLFDELLDISKLDAGYVKPAPSHFPARVLFERLETAYAPLARRSNLVLSLDHSDAVLHTDAVLLERVLGNLIANALRYTPAGSVRVSCRDAGERVAIAVADTGVGIPREEHEKVFDEFYQLGNPERDRRKGLGLGLATVKRMTQLLGCRVTLDSAPGRGSVFAVEVPKGDAAQVAPTSGEVSAEDVNALHGKVIAVIDDERDVRDGLAELLGQWRCKPLVAASTAELLHQLGAERPDAVIADYRLREHQTGVGVARALRERYGAALPVLIMSGDTTQEIFTAVREHRLPLLSKPVRAARLRAALLHLLSREPAAVPDA
jgi:signal transduction histidine kinase/CheY-like chemotaxis protein